jgi:hypothetical protein
MTFLGEGFLAAGFFLTTGFLVGFGVGLGVALAVALTLGLGVGVEVAANAVLVEAIIAMATINDSPRLFIRDSI